LGDFAFEEVEPGSYRLEIRLPEQVVVVEGLQIGA
jgi:hypothetical protein